MSSKRDDGSSIVERLGMSFSFGFSGDDLDDEGTSGVPRSVSDGVTKNINANPIDDIRSGDLREPQMHSLESLLESLIDLRVTFQKYVTPQNQTVYRRELFDVKHQLMHEDDDNNDELRIMLGTTSEDLRKNIYEGGLKSWECSVDTVDLLSTWSKDKLFKKDADFLELGCGTSLPSTYIFHKAILFKQRDVKFVLSDYNASVLRLVTLPNLIITWANTLLTPQELISLQKTGNQDIPIVEDELQFSAQLISSFRDFLKAQNIEFSLISGGWSRDFMNIITENKRPFGLIISSETIYSQETLPIVGEMLLEILQKQKLETFQECVALVAAKDIYFGVGGSMVEFEEYLSRRIAHNKLDISFKTQKISSGLKRSIVLIK